MPPRKVYGKSRSNYDPLAVFDSPQRPPPREADKRVNTERKALQPLNVNRAAHVVLPTNPNISKSQKLRRIVVEDSEDEQEDKIDVRLPSITVAEPQKPWKITVENSEDDQDDIDQVPQAVQKLQGTCNNVDANFQNETREEPLKNEYEQHCSEILALSSHGIATYADWSEQLSNHFSITKIAEASFSEVYRLSLLEEYSDLSSSDESVFKVIPLRSPDWSSNSSRKATKASTIKQNESSSSPADVANEVRLLLRMNEVPGFTNFRDVRIIQGRPPQPFVKAYKDFNALQRRRKKDLSLFPDPSKKASYPEDQLWAVIEMQDAGTDLEQFVESAECSSIFLVWDIFWQVALSLAKGEEAAQFEHRDLHLGNICVRMPAEDAEQDLKRKLNFTGVEATIIDYTISRALMENGEVAYNDLAADSTIFDGDSTEEYQYDIYRYMRGAALLDNPHADFFARPQPLDRSWQQYHPISNLIWLHFMLYKLLNQVARPSARREPAKKRKEAHRRWKRENDLEHVLQQVARLLDVDKICQSLIECASDLVGLALREGWLDEEDVLGVTEADESLVKEFESLAV